MSSSETVVYDDIPLIQPPELPDSAKEVTSDCFIETDDETELKNGKTEEVPVEEISSDEELQVTEESEVSEKIEPKKKPMPKPVKKTPAKAKTRAKRQKRKKSTPPKKLAKKRATTKSVKFTPVIKKEKEEPKLMEPNLPKGWTRKAIQRQSGVSAGKFDVYIFSPDSKRFRSRTELSNYLEETDSPLYIQQFDFTVKRIGSDEAQPAKTKKTQIKAKKQPKQHPASRKAKVTPKSVSQVIKPKAASQKLKPNKKLVVKLNFASSGRRTIKRPARYSNLPDFPVIKTEKNTKDIKEEPSSPRTPKAKAIDAKKPDRTTLKAAKKTKKRTSGNSNLKSTKSISEVISKDLSEKSKNSPARTDQGISVEAPKSQDDISEANDTDIRQSNKRAGSPKAATPSKKSKKPKIVSPKIESDSAQQQPMCEEGAKEVQEEPVEVESEGKLEKITAFAPIAEEPTVIDTNGFQEVQSEIVTDAPVPADEDVTETDSPQKEQPIKDSPTHWDVPPSDSPKSTKSTNSDLYTMVKNACVRALWKIK